MTRRTIYPRRFRDAYTCESAYRKLAGPFSYYNLQLQHSTSAIKLSPNIGTGNPPGNEVGGTQEAVCGRPNRERESVFKCVCVSCCACVCVMLYMCVCVCVYVCMLYMCVCVCMLCNCVCVCYASVCMCKCVHVWQEHSGFL